MVESMLLDTTQLIVFTTSVTMDTAWKDLAVVFVHTEEVGLVLILNVSKITIIMMKMMISIIITRDTNLSNSMI